MSLFRANFETIKKLIMDQPDKKRAQHLLRFLMRLIEADEHNRKLEYNPQIPYRDFWARNLLSLLKKTWLDKYQKGA